MRARMKKHVALSTVRDELTQVMDALPPARQIEVLDFARFLQQGVAQPEQAPTPPSTDIQLRAVPAETLRRLSGLVSWGGDAVEDTEAIYDDTDRN